MDGANSGFVKLRCTYDTGVSHGGEIVERHSVLVGTLRKLLGDIPKHRAIESTLSVVCWVAFMNKTTVLGTFWPYG